MPENNIGTLFDRVIREKPLKNDAALARLLEVSPAIISRMRNLSMEPGPTIILALADLGGIPLNDIRAVVPRKPLDAGRG